MLIRSVTAIQRYRAEHGVGIQEADLATRGAALALYETLTGVRETNPLALWHHRASFYGPPCRECGIPLRTPQASPGVACGARRDRSRRRPGAANGGTGCDNAA